MCYVAVDNIFHELKRLHVTVSFYGISKCIYLYWLKLHAGMSDFQYLLADREPDGTYRAINDQVYLTGLQSRTWIDEQTPLCLLPPTFSRFEHPTMYCYRDPPTHRSGYEQTLPKLDPNVIGIGML